MQSSHVRPLISVEYFLRLAAWLLALTSEEFFAAVMKIKLLQGNVNYYGLLISFAALLCLAIRFLGPFPVIRDLEELCFYDLLVQVYGLILYLVGMSFASYLIAAIAVYLLKFVRLIWWGRNFDGELLRSWPVFGFLGYFAKDRIEEQISIKHKFAIYLAVVLTIIAAFFVWLFFERVPSISMFFVGILPVVILTKHAAMDIQRRDEERIESIRELERTKLIAEFNADAAARNIDLRGAAHDLNNPVMAMTYTARDITHCTDLASAKEIAQNMEAGLRDLSDLIVEVVEMARLGTKLKAPVDDVVYLPNLCRHFSRELRALAQERGIRLDIDEANYAVKSNEWLLKRIIHNLLMNAIVHGKKKTIVKLSIRRNAHDCFIRVWDTGPGIAGADGPDRAANFKNLINNLHRAKVAESDQAKRQVSGHGLGLRGVLRMSNTLGLQITMRSRVGMGTMFRFKVPLAQAADLPPDF